MIPPTDMCAISSGVSIAAVSRLVESHQTLHNMSRDLSRRMI